MDEKKKLEFSDSAEILIKEVLEEADAEVEELIHNAEKKSKILIQDEKKKLIAEVKRMFEDVDEKIEKEREARLSEVQAQIKKEILEAKEERINAIISLIKQKLLDFTKQEEYKTFLEEIFQKMINYLSPNTDYRLYLNKEDIKAFPQSKIDQIIQSPNKHVILQQEDFIQEHGIKIVSADGKFMLEDTIEGRFTQQFEKVRTKVANMLFQK